jgi:ATP synthase protein I
MHFDYKKNRTWAEHLSIVMQLGLTMAGCIGFCFFIGYWLDKWLGTKGIFITIFIILGVLGGGNVAYRQILETISDDHKDQENTHNGSG